MQIPHTTPAQWPQIAPGRFAASIRQAPSEGCQIALIGLPDDLGVRLNGGRAGAALGPKLFRESLAKFGTAWDGLRRRPLSAKIFDAGDILPAPGEDEAALAETHRRVETAVHALHAQGLVVVAIGGGHDLAFPSIAALAQHAGHAIGGINLDAHLDVRERVGSGMPFRSLIDAGWLTPERFAEVGLGRFANDEIDLAWLTQKGATQIFAEHVFANGIPIGRLFDVAGRVSPIFVSIDLDGIDAASAPGVSALNPMGLSVSDAAALAEAAGAEAAVRHFDLMELSPPHDASGRTGRVASFLFLCFVSGFEARGR